MLILEHKIDISMLVRGKIKRTLGKQLFNEVDSLLFMSVTK
jgi:hypothetical protein